MTASFGTVLLWERPHWPLLLIVKHYKLADAYGLSMPQMKTLTNVNMLQTVLIIDAAKNAFLILISSECHRQKPYGGILQFHFCLPKALTPNFPEI